MPSMFGSGGSSMNAYDINTINHEGTVANRPNQTNPWGTTNWTGGNEILDPQGRHTGTYNPWSSSTTLSPYEQQRFDLGAGLQGRVASELQPLDTSSLTPWGSTPQSGEAARSAAENALYGKATARLDPQWAQKKSAFDSQMAAQGVHPGDSQYNDAYKNFSMSQNDAYSGAQQNAVIGGLAEQQGQFGMGLQQANFQDTQRQQQIAQQLQAAGWTLGQINALMAGVTGSPQATQPNSTAIDPTNSIIGQTNYNQQQQNQSMNNFGSLVGTAATMISDERAKDIIGTGEADLEEFLDASSGAEYEYRPEFKDIGGHGTYVSPMAQDLERTRLGRDMVFNTPHGKMVDYGRGLATFASALGHVNRKLNMVMGL